MTEPVLHAQDLVRDYPVSGRWWRRAEPLHALRGVSLSLPRGRTLAVVGESGCGKSTLARLLALIEPATRGTLVIEGENVSSGHEAAHRRMRPRVQMVFQNPYASLNPRQTLAATLEEPLVVSRMHPPGRDRGWGGWLPGGAGDREAAAQRRAAVTDMAVRVGLRPEHLQRYPHMFSGGQRQRAAIARAMMLDPAVVVADEPTSALDVSVQAQILNLFLELQEARDTAFVFVSHNLGVVERVAHEVLVMYLGQVVESGPARDVLRDPWHPYTQALQACRPSLNAMQRRTLTLLAGETPSPQAIPPGCTFHSRCPRAQDRCREQAPLLRPSGARHVACHLVADP